MDADYPGYEESRHSYDNIFVEPYGSPMKDLEPGLPFGLFRNFSLKDSENDENQTPMKAEANDDEELMVSPGRFIRQSSQKKQ